MEATCEGQFNEKLDECDDMVFTESDCGIRPCLCKGCKDDCFLCDCAGCLLSKASDEARLFYLWDMKIREEMN